MVCSIIEKRRQTTPRSLVNAAAAGPVENEIEIH